MACLPCQTVRFGHSLNTVGDRIPNIPIWKPFEYQTFWRSVLEWFSFGMVRTKARAMVPTIPKLYYYITPYYFWWTIQNTNKSISNWNGGSKAKPLINHPILNHPKSEHVCYLGLLSMAWPENQTAVLDLKTSSCLYCRVGAGIPNTFWIPMVTHCSVFQWSLVFHWCSISDKIVRTISKQNHWKSELPNIGFPLCLVFQCVVFKPSLYFKFTLLENSQKSGNRTLTEDRTWFPLTTIEIIKMITSWNKKRVF